MSHKSHIDLVSEPESSQKSAQERANSDFVDSAESLSELEKLKTDLEQANSRTLRALADLENYRSRAIRQANEERMYCNIDLMRDLLPVWDNIGRALEAVDQSNNLESLVEGVRLVHQQFLDVLQKYHCESFETKGELFDPNCSQSIALIPNDAFPANTVIEETQRGFRLHDRVVRPAQVVLSAGPAN
ncbi:MAG: nucleotide exchange factor GrpE [Thermoguttaceae bacterium]